MSSTKVGGEDEKVYKTKGSESVRMRETWLVVSERAIYDVSNGSIWG